jgi:hypothetical protein
LSWDARLWACLVLGCAAYALLSVLLVVVWSTILNTFEPDCIGAREAFALYATTQIMKYVPSNIVHFVGRHVALRRRGVPHLALVSTVFAEAAVLACGACLAMVAFETDVLAAVYRRHVATDGVRVIMTIGLVCCAAAGLLWLHRAGLHRPVAPVLASRFVARLSAALAGPRCSSQQAPCSYRRCVACCSTILPGSRFPRSRRCWPAPESSASSFPAPRPVSACGKPR